MAKSDRSTKWRHVLDRMRFRGALDIAQQLAKESRCTLEELAGRTRGPRAVAARHATWKALVAGGFSVNGVAKLFGVNHTTVLVALGRSKAGVCICPTCGGKHRKGGNAGARRSRMGGGS